MSKTNRRIESLTDEEAEVIRSLAPEEGTVGGNCVHNGCQTFAKRAGRKIGRKSMRRLLLEHQDGDGNSQGQKTKPKYKRWTFASCVH